MDEEYKERRAATLGYRPQKENVYNNLLPYASYLDEESEKLFVAIKSNLVKSVLAREISPGCILWISRLNQYITIYGLKFSKEDHIALVKLFYELMIIPDLDPTRISKCAYTLSQLLKKRYLLSRDELQLDWRPLYDLLDRTFRTSKCNIGMYRFEAGFETTIYTAVRSCKTYFPASATQEILDEFRPKLCPFNDKSMQKAVQYLELLLPNAVKPEEADISYKLWFDEFMALLEVCPNTTAWENNMMWILSGLARFQIGYIDWTPHVPGIFARFLRSSSLPVNFKQFQTLKQSRIDTGAMAVWIVFTLRGDETTTFFYLEKLMQALESYFQPANFGRWSQKLREFLKKLSYFFVQRVHVERHHTTSWNNNVPDHFKLTDADIDRFVNILKPCIQLAILTRSRFADVSLTLSYLSSLRPNLIIPDILNNLYSSMDSVTEPHKFTANVEAMAAVGRYMIRGAESNYPEGPTQVIPVLIAVLPGIDPNDLPKSMVTVIFIKRFVSMIPLIDSSKAHLHYNDLSEEEHMICEASAELEDFVLQFFDRLFVWIESNSLDFVRLEQSTSNVVKEPSVVEYELSSVVEILLTQCSPSIFYSALRKFYNFVTDKILEVKVAGKIVGEVVRHFSVVNPVETLKLFLPYLLDYINDVILDNPHIAEEEHVDPKFLFNLQVLSEVVDGRQELVNYLDKLMKILDQTLHMACVDVQLLSARILDLMLSSLTKLRPTEQRSSTVDYGTSLDNFLSVREWAKSYKIHDVNINWYIPKAPEIKAVQTLVDKYLIPELEKLNSWANKEISLGRQEVKCSLKIVRSVLSCHLMLPIWEEPPYELVDTVLDPGGFDVMVLNEGKITLPDGQNVRKAVIDTLRKVQKMLLNVDEGDTQSFKQIISTYYLVLFNQNRNQDFDMHWRIFHISKKRMEDRLHQKKLHMRYLHIDRAMLQQEFRIESRTCLFTQTHKNILEALFELGISRYSEVRMDAQAILSAMLRIFPFSYTVLTEKFKEILQVDSVANHEAFKGCLYILLCPKLKPVVAKHDWNFIKEIWPLLVTSIPSEKPSIINLISALTDAVNLDFPTIAINLTIPDRTLQVAYELANTRPYICNLTGFQRHIDNGEAYSAQRSLERKNAYDGITDCLLASLETGNLHWRYTEMAITFINSLIHHDVKYNSKVVRYFLKATINESISIRKSAIKMLVYITIQNKPKFHKIEVDPYQFSKSTNNKVLIPGQREDNMWLLYDPKTVPTTAAQWEESRYLHDNYTGYYTWPKHLMLYAPPSQQKTVASRLNNMSATEKEIYDFFKNEENVAQLINYLSLEEKKGTDGFDIYRFIVFKNIFKMFEDELLPIFLPHIERLVEDRQESSQICAAELIAAIIRGSKHWSFEKTEKLWKRFIPFLKTAVANIGNETLKEWTACVTMAAESRDPNRCHWLLEFLMEDPLKDSTSFIANSRLFMLASGLRQQPWRNVRIFTQLTEYFKPHLTNPYENIRDNISEFLVLFYGSDLIFPKGAVSQGPRIENFLSDIVPKLEQLYKYLLVKAEISAGSDMEANCDTLSTVTLDNEKDELIRLFKTVARYSSLSMKRLNFTTRPMFWKFLLLGAILQSDEIHEEIPRIDIYMALLAHSVTNKAYILDAIAAIREVVNCPLWSARAIIADFLSVFVFYNMPTLQSSQDWVLQIQEMVLQLLEDPQPEVRIQAAKLLSGLLHCQFISQPTELLPIFKQKASIKIRKGKPPGETSSTGKNLISQRHAGILGLCSFIDAHPYDVPDYFPTIFETLGRHLNDPQPIPATIRKTMGDFKRTHHDNWELHKLKFTEDELLVLSDLSLPPSYCI